MQKKIALALHAPQQVGLSLHLIRQKQSKLFGWDVEADALQCIKMCSVCVCVLLQSAPKGH